MENDSFSLNIFEFKYCESWLKFFDLCKFRVPSGQNFIEKTKYNIQFFFYNYLIIFTLIFVILSCIFDWVLIIFVLASYIIWRLKGKKKIFLKFKTHYLFYALIIIGVVIKFFSFCFVFGNSLYFPIAHAILRSNVLVGEAKRLKKERKKAKKEQAKKAKEEQAKKAAEAKK